MAYILLSKMKGKETEVEVKKWFQKIKLINKAP